MLTTQKSLLKSIRVFHACMVTTIGFLSASYIVSYTSPIEDSILSTGILTINTYSIFVTAINIGGLLGAMTAGPVSEWLGIKTSLIAFSQIAVMGIMLLIWAHDGVSMIVGRIFVGYYTSTCQSLVPVYNAEISVYSMKKFYGGMLGVSIRFGLLLSYSLGIWIDYHSLALTYLVMIVFMNINLVFLPESPKWLRNKGWVSKAEKATEYFYNIPQENVPILETTAEEPTTETHSTTLKQKVANYFIWPVLRPLLICCSLQIFKTFSGHQYLLAYAAHVLDKAVSINPKIAALFYPISLLIGAIQFLWLIHKFHWKKLLLTTTLIQIFANALMSLTLYLSMHTFQCNGETEYTTACGILQAAPMVFISLIGFSFGLGWGSIAWWLYGQILHKYYTRISAGIVTFSFFAACIANQLIGPLVVEFWGPDALFLGFALICSLGFVVQILY